MQPRTVNVACKRSDTVMPASSATIAGNLVFTYGHVGWPHGTMEAPTRIVIEMTAALPDSETHFHSGG